MIKVMIVDDEYLARQVMKQTIEWEKYKCRLCAEASNGVEAVEIAKKIRPDIVITDINMPGKDGIEMAKEIKNFNPECNFIVITGYDEFEYARAAVKISAVDFILKPIDEDEFVSSIKKAVKDVEKKRETCNITSEKILLNMMRGKIQIKELDLESNGIYLNNIVIVNIKNDSYENLLENDNVFELYSQNGHIIQIIKENIKDCYVIECHEDKLAIILKADEIGRSLDIHECIQNVKDLVEKKTNTTISLGISNIFNINYIRDAYEQSKEALKNRLYFGKNNIMYYDSINFSVNGTRVNIEQNERELILSIKACDKVKVEKRLSKIYEYMKENRCSTYFIKQVSIELVLKVLNILADHNIKEDKIFGKQFNVYKNADTLSTINELYSWVLKVMLDVIRNIKISMIEKEENGVERAIQYIKSNYCSDITLSEISSKVYLNESYLSRKIKQRLGINFKEYLTKLRMEKAIGLLNKPNIRVSEVANQVGYMDYRRFTSNFKKYTGYSPSEFLKIK
ncbi:response regulator [Haloimpatiens sp. FM7330]|uniref:response regulator transcription factor n=1 Tax=Haloimpatiens sp. FM7330 TaxID=3298610 RepID=UPI0036322119